MTETIKTTQQAWLDACPKSVLFEIALQLLAHVYDEQEALVRMHRVWCELFAGGDVTQEPTQAPPAPSYPCAPEAAFHEGDVVTIHAKTGDGRPYIAGTAVIVGCGYAEDEYRVQFQNRRGKNRDKVSIQSVHPGESQSDPAGYLAKAEAKWQIEDDAAEQCFRNEEVA